VWEARYQALVAETSAEFPGFAVIRKSDSALQRLIGQVLRVVTFGVQNAYLTHYTTTIGRHVYVVDDWDQWPAEQRYVTLRHERVHLRQFARYTLVGMAFLYLFVPLPAGLAWFRAHFEKEAYAESIRATAEVWGLARVRQPEQRAQIVRQFTSGNYGWMWPFRAAMERWYDAVVRSLENGA